MEKNQMHKSCRKMFGRREISNKNFGGKDYESGKLWKEKSREKFLS
jgi:hypothetical protein